ncbi:hypothetical protein [Catellatospora citrea]|uniref:hypothetical protein n=1 Tax=Catellatospora citrea TaxID=53366 RepID=UPI000FEFEBBA|nr:hypothetical protein [Catellatospora citrea]RKE00383.1 hypothetical protein C8E86_8255 [Catellatospora citrea]
MTARRLVRAVGTVLAVLIGGTTAVLTAEAVQAAYGHRAQAQPWQAHSVPRFDPLAAARETEFYRTHPPATGLWEIAQPSDQPGLPDRHRRWTIAWVPASDDYGICFATPAPGRPAGSGCFELPTRPSDTGLIAAFWTADVGLLDLLGIAPAGVDSVEALAIEGTRATTTRIVAVDRGPELPPVRLFVLIPQRVGGRLGQVQLIGRDAVGQIVARRTFEDQGL